MVGARTAFPVFLVVGCLTLAWPVTAAAPTARPEEVGLSSDRLRRVNELVQRHIAAGSFSGAVTLVARNRRIAHHEAHGLMDLEAKKPMAKDGIFRIMSMTKPVIGVAVLMMMEEGKVRLQDPVSRFIPEWRNMTVGVPLPSAPGARGGGAAPGGRARFEVPPNAGKVVAVEWNFEGAGSYVPAEFGDIRPAVSVKATHSYSQPGTYFPVLRATSQREGDPETAFGRVQNLGRARVVVK